MRLWCIKIISQQHKIEPVLIGFVGLQADVESDAVYSQNKNKLIKNIPVEMD